MIVTMMRVMPSLALGLLLAACQTAAPADPAAGVPTRVDILDAAWVQFEGERRPLEYFLLEMRHRVRAAAGDIGRMPFVIVHITAGTSGTDARWLGRFRSELHKAGVRQLSLGTD